MAKRKLTRKEKENRIREALSDVASTIGLGDPATVKKQFQAFLSKPSPRGLEQATATGIGYGLRLALERELRKCRTEEQLERIVTGIRSRGTQFPTIIRKGLEEMKRNLPRHGGPGRGQTLSHAQKIKACEQISSMQKTTRTSFPDIFECVAEGFRHGGTPVSARTIKRTWQQRTSLYT